jgi:hypothetical protein
VTNAAWQVVCLPTVALSEFFDDYPHLHTKLETRVRLKANAEVEKRRNEKMENFYPNMVPTPATRCAIQMAFSQGLYMSPLNFFKI